MNYVYRKHRKEVHALKSTGRRTNLERLLLFLTESGMLYSLYWVSFSIWYVSLT